MTGCNSVLTPMEPRAKLSKYDGGERVTIHRTYFHEQILILKRPKSKKFIRYIFELDLFGRYMY